MHDAIFVVGISGVSVCTTLFLSRTFRFPRRYFFQFARRYFCRGFFGRFSLHDVPCRSVFTRLHIYDYRRRCSAHNASRPCIYPGFRFYFQYLNFYQILNPAFGTGFKNLSYRADEGLSKLSVAVDARSDSSLRLLVQSSRISHPRPSDHS